MDTTNWKNFRIKNLFDIKKGKRLTSEDQIKGNTPYVGAIDSNNGIANYIQQEPQHSGNTISLSYNGSVAEAFYQLKPFWATDDVNVLYPKFEMNIAKALFICTILKKEKYRYSYGRKWVLEKMNETIISLPATPDGDVDWQWIENYMKSIQKKIQIPTTSHKNSKPLPLNVDNWKKFRVGDLFRLETGKVNSTELLEEGNDCYYLGAKKEDNGIMSKCKYNQDFITKGNCIVFICDGQGSIGLNNYMDRDFIATVNLIMGYNKHLNPLIGCFLVTILDLERPKFSFGRKRKTHLADTEIALPAMADGTPDWLFMENYVKSLPYGDCL